MSLWVDTTPLRVSKDFRRLWFGQAVSSIGTMISMAALPFQVFHETGSSFAVGFLGLAELVPMLLFALVGGAFADSIDKRRLLLGVTVAAMLCSTALAFNASLDHPKVWVMFLVGAISSGVRALSHLDKDPLIRR